MTQHSIARVIAALTAVYGFLLYSLSRDFRVACGPFMAQTFKTSCSETWRGSGALAALKVAVLEAIDLILMAVRERLRAWKHWFRVAFGGGAVYPRSSGPDGQRGRVREFIAQTAADIRQGVRALLRRPAYTVVALITLGIGIGANTAIFSVVDTVILRPLPYEDPNGIYNVWNHLRDSDLIYAAHKLEQTRMWRDQQQVFGALEFHDTRAFIIRGEGEPELVTGAYISTGMLPFLGVEPVLGRNFLDEERVDGQANVVILSDGVWRRRFGADPDVLGKQLELGDQIHTVVGVMPPDFRFPTAETRLWVPAAEEPIQAADARFFDVLVRLRDGVSVEQAQNDADIVAERLQEEQPRDEGWYVQIRSHNELRVGKRSRTALYVLSGAVGLVLLIACANIANLSLSVATSRQREMAVRAALGASRFRIARHVMAESILLGSAGGLLGLVLAFWSVPLLVRLAPDNYTFLAGNTIAVDGRVLAFAIGIAVVSGLVSGLIPSIRGSQAFGLGLGSDRSVVGSRPQQRTRNGLVVFEIALSLILLIGAGLLIKSFMRLNRVDLGFNPENVIALTLQVGESSPDQDLTGATVKDLQESIASVPGVTSVAAANGLPPRGGGISFGVTPEAEGYPVPAAGKDFVLPSQVVGPSYFEVMQIPLLEGRPFTDEDRDTDVIIVNEAMVEHYWQGDSPVGKRFRVEEKREWHTVIGVAADVRAFGRVDPFGAIEMYYPLAGRQGRQATFAIRASVDPIVLIPMLKQRIWQLDDRIPISSVSSIEQRLSDAVAEPRFLLMLTGVFATVALSLAAIGLYGVMAYGVTQQTREIGIRIALGAERGAVLIRVLRQGLLLAIAGTFIGLVGSFWLTKLMDSMLFEVAPSDPATFAGVAVLLVGVALVASYVPARRATRVDPLVALRTDD